jgi:hypothetical protein
MQTNLNLSKLAYGYNYLIDILVSQYPKNENDPNDKEYLITYRNHFTNLDLSKFIKNKNLIEEIKKVDPMIQCNVWTNIENNQTINLFYIYRNPLNESGEYMYILEKYLGKKSIYLGCGSDSEHPILFSEYYCYNSSDGHGSDVDPINIADIDNINLVFDKINQLRYKYLDLVKDLVL